MPRGPPTWGRACGMRPDALARTLTAGTRLAAVNPAPSATTALLFCPDPPRRSWSICATARAGTQSVEGGLMVDCRTCRPTRSWPWGRGTRRPPVGLSIRTEGDAFVLENDLLKVVLDGSGEILDLHDKEAGRAVLAPGRPATTCSPSRTVPWSGTPGTSTSSTRMRRNRRRRPRNRGYRAAACRCGSRAPGGRHDHQDISLGTPQAHRFRHPGRLA